MVLRQWLPKLALLSTLGCQRITEHTDPRPASPPHSLLPAPTPAQIRLTGNHLVAAASAYLLQHSHNPVDWHEWGPEALALAVALDRPIFLSIGYVSCHWCHVMEREVFEQDDVAAFLNAHFVSIKVDREERPDLDAAYMSAVETMTGSGGWPMTVLLTPSLRPFFGGTYLPHERFLQVIRGASEQFGADRNAVESRGAEVYARIAAVEPSFPAPALSASELRQAARQTLTKVDAVFGGFRGRTKFPTPIKWQFLLDAYRKWGDQEVAEAVHKTLDAMSSGGIRDHVAGGFFRYSTEPTWTVPHFEKMLYDNAQLAALYLEAAATFRDPNYRAVGLDTLDFLLNEMKTDAGGFGSSFDADAAGVEGSTYLWTPSQLRAVLGDADGRALGNVLGATDAGNFDGSNVLTRRQVARAPEQSTGRATSRDVELWLRARTRLARARRERPQPMFDSKLVTAWNGLAIRALSIGYRVSGEARYLDAAERAAEAIWRLNRAANGALTRTANQPSASAAAILDDYAFLSSAFVELFQATGKPSYLERAVALAKQATERFGSPEGAFYLTSGSPQEPLGRRLAIDDGVEPSGNAVMIRTLEALSALTGQGEFLNPVTQALGRYAGSMRQRGIEMAGWLDGALLLGGPSYEVVIAGERGALSEAWNQLLAPWTVGVQIAPREMTAALVSVMPTAADKHDRAGTALAYVCVRGACQKPTTDATQLLRQIQAGWVR